MDRRLDLPRRFEPYETPVHLFAQQFPTCSLGDRAFTFLRSDLQIEGALTFRSLDAEARALAATLQHLGLQQQRAILLYPPGREFIIGFVACLYAGAVAVPVIPPRSARSTDTLRRLALIAKDSEPAIVLTTARIKHMVEDVDTVGFRALSAAVRILDGVVAAADEWNPPDVTADSLAMLQYTSGSTGSPKGVMVSHGNLVANAESMWRTLRMSDRWTFVSWLPPYHDMGLIGTILQPMFTAGHCYVLSPTAFFQRPAIWLEAISRFRGVMSGAPNFAYDLCVDRISDDVLTGLDLSSWQIAFNGAEPIRPGTLARFSARFAAAGLRETALFPCYGLAEATLLVSGGPADGRPVTVSRAGEDDDVPGARLMAASGMPDAGQHVAIVEPETGRPRAEGEVGEIWVAGENIAHGYWRRPAQTKLVFGARMEGRDERFLRTGDLGFIRGDQLFVSGRLKDVIVIRGRNYDPTAIEQSVRASHPTLRSGASAAFSVVVGRDEQLVVAQELDRRDLRRVDPARIFTAIRRAVADAHGLEVHAIVLVRPGALVRTASGKLQRWHYRAAFLRGDLPTVAQWRQHQRPARSGRLGPLTATDIEQWLIARVVARLGVPPAAPTAHDAFAAFDFDSSDAVAVSLDLENWLDLDLSPSMFFEHPTIAQLASFLSRRIGQPPSPTQMPAAAAAAGPRETAMNDIDARLATLSPAKRALATIQAQANGVGSGGRGEPIAIVGMACRFPGANGPAAYWDLLRNGVDAIREIPSDRWDVEQFYDPDPEAPGKMYSRWGGFVPDVDKFDAKFFAISPREAVGMDPQQRFVLEVAWEALEHAGLVQEQLVGGKHGVFLGISNEEYSSQFRQDDPALIDPYTGTGVAFSVASGRLAYLLGFRGPTMSVDTACSSSLVSVALACQSLQLKECNLALAGGVNLILSPRGAIYFCKVRVLADDGRCKTFDARANGYVRGEGCGFVVLKRLSDAIASRDNILAVIRGAAVNHDGSSGGLTVPSGQAQQEVIAEALTKAGIKPADVGYVEAHGTGTAIGDPIEVRALGHALGEGRTPAHPLYIGSVKTNIGHLEAAAGVAGLIKIVLAVQHAEIPPHLNFAQPSRHIDLAGFHGRIPIALTPWPNGNRRIAGVSSFGLSGTNAHVIVEAHEAPRDAAADASHERLLVPLSARSPRALTDLASKYGDWLTLTPEAHASFAHFAHSTGVRRSHHNYRAALSATSRDDLVEKLRAVASGAADPGVIVGRVAASRLRKLVFVFPGQGSQWTGMARDLIERQPVFRATLMQCDAAIRPHSDFSVVDWLMSPESAPDGIDTIQPVLFAIQVALSALWRSWGVVPHGVIGHSMGEVAAAHVAGALTLDAAATIICRRSRLLKRASGQGAMAMVDLSMDDTARAIERLADRVAVAVSNSPRSTVISGDPAAIDELLDTLAADGVFCRRVKVDVASHSPQVDALHDDLLLELRDIESVEPQMPMYSTVSGNAVMGPALGAQYWMDNLRRPVLFSQTLQKMIGNGYDVFVEISPHPILLPAIEDVLRHLNRAGTAVASLRRDADALATLHDAVSVLYVNGVNPDWRALSPSDGRFIPIPTYPWQSERYWLPEELSVQADCRSRLRRGHPFVGESWVSSLHGDTTCEIELGTTEFPYLKDHQLSDEVVLPGVFYLEMALAASRRIFGDRPVSLEDVVFRRALVIGEGETPTLQTVLSPEVNGAATFAISSRSNGADTWQLHASGTLRGEARQETQPASVLLDVERQMGTPVDVDTFYEGLEKRGLRYGPAFRNLARIFVGDRESLGQLRVAESFAYRARKFHLNPLVLDAAFQLIAASLSTEHAADPHVRYLPVGIGRLRLFGPVPVNCWAHVQHAAPGMGGAQSANVQLLDAAGNKLLEVTGLRLQRLAAPSGEPDDLSRSIYRVEWQRGAPVDADALGEEHALGAWLVFADEGTAATALVRALERRGARCTVVSIGASFESIGERRFAIRPTSPDDYRRLLREAFPNDAPALSRVVHMWSLDASPVREISIDTLRTAHERATLSVLRLTQALVDTKWLEYPRLWIVTRGAQAADSSPDAAGMVQAPLWGFSRSLALEHPELRCARIDLGTAESVDEQLSMLVNELCRDGREDQIAFREGSRLVARLRRVEPDANARRRFVTAGRRPFRATIASPGTLDGVSFGECPRRLPDRGEVEIEVHATGLNFSDIMKVLGIYQGLEPGVIPIGLECSGTISASSDGVDFRVGQPVVALAPFSFASYAVAPAQLVFAKPEFMTFEEAATLPAAFLTAYYALVEVGRIASGERVLIHSGSGGVGLAGIQIARRAGAEIFTTAGSPAKREYLRSLGIGHVMDSRSTEFADQVLEYTGGGGVDIVLNSLPGEAIPKGLSVLAAFGRFLELGKRDIFDNRQLGLLAFRNNISFCSIDLEKVFREKPQLAVRMFRELVALFESRELVPLPYTVFPMASLSEGLRFMAQAKHIGKVVFSRRPPDAAGAIAPLRIRDDRTYVITGGLGALGLKIADWLITQGARHVALVGRRGPDDLPPENARALQALSMASATVRLHRADVSDAGSLSAALDEIRLQMPPLAGVVHAAGTLDDALVVRMDERGCDAVMKPKIDGSWNLHQLTIHDDLDFFVLFSSAASVLGSPGQANYAAANAFLDALAHYRRAQGRPAMSINWSYWGEAGLAARPDRGSRLAARGIRVIEPGEGVDAFELLINQDEAQLCVLPIDFTTWLARNPYVRDLPVFAELVRPGHETEGVMDSTVLAQLKALPGGRARRALLETHLKQQIGQVLRLPESEIDATAPLQSMGFDSLMALELRNRLEASLSVTLSATMAWNFPTIVSLAGHLAERMRLPLDEASEAGTSMPSPPAVDSSVELANALVQLRDLSPDSATDAH